MGTTVQGTTRATTAARRGGAILGLVGTMALLSAFVFSTTAGATTNATLKEAHVGSTNPGFETGSCPEAGWGWHFVLPGNETTFVSVSITFEHAGVITTFTSQPTGKHAYVYTPGPDTLLGGTAVVDGPETTFVLSHVCTGSTTTTTTAPTTTAPSTTMPTTTVPEVTTTVPEVTTTVPEVTTTVPEVTTTVPEVTTTVPEVTTTVPESTTTVPEVTTTLPEETTTSTAPAAIGAIDSETTTTAAAVVEGENIGRSPEAVTAAPVAQVLGVTATRPATAATGQLPVTGSSPLLPLVGLCLLVGGLALVATARQRTAV